LLAVVRRILQRFGPPKQGIVARACGLTESHFSEALKADGKKHFSVDWLEHIKPYDFEQEIPAYFARKYGLELREPRPVSDGTWRRKVTHILNHHNGLGQALLAEAMALPDDEFGDDDHEVSR
jgi:hypothetical protein